MFPNPSLKRVIPIGRRHQLLHSSISSFQGGGFVKSLTTKSGKGSQEPAKERISTSYWKIKRAAAIDIVYVIDITATPYGLYHFISAWAAQFIFWYYHAWYNLNTPSAAHKLLHIRIGWTTVFNGMVHDHFHINSTTIVPIPIPVH